MSKKISKMYFSRLRKIEVKDLASKVITIVEGYDPEALKIKEIFDLLVEQKPQIDFLDVPYGPHLISSDLVALRRRRIAIAQGIVDKVKSIEYGKTIGTDEDLKIAKSFVTRYLKGLRRDDQDEALQKVKQINYHCNNDLALTTAFEALDLTKDLDSLLHVNIIIETKYLQRGKSVSARPKDPTPGIVANLKEKLEDLFKDIDLAKIKNRDIDYKPLTDDLNEELAKYRAKLNTRASYFMNKAEQERNEANGVEKHGEVVVMSGSEEPSASIQSTERMIPTNVEVGDSEDNLDLLDIKKTVAVSGKQTRLPIVSDEA